MVPLSILVYNLSYTDSLPRADAFEHTHLVAALSGLANRDAPRLYTPYLPADAEWMAQLTTPSTAWLHNATFEVVPSGSGGALRALVNRTRSIARLRGIVLYDPNVPATSNVASTAAGVENLLPVCKRTGSSEFPTVYDQLVGNGSEMTKKPLLPVLLDLTAQGFHSAPSAKAAAYLWAIKRYLNSSSSSEFVGGGGADPSVLAYYVDYFGATLLPPKPGVPTLAPTPPPPPGARDRITQGETLKAGESLVSSNGQYHLDMQEDGNLVLYNSTASASASVLWASSTKSSGSKLELTMHGELNVVGSDGATRWSSKTSGNGDAFWLWCQHDGNLVVYAGTCCSGAVVWSTQTAQTVQTASISSSSSTTTLSDTSSSGSDYLLTTTTNHDYFIARKAFFFDLSIWSDETPNDEPWQPLGSDRKTLDAVLSAAHAAAGAETMIHMGGFTPWHFKYVSDGMCSSRCKHPGVATEWATVVVTSSYNVFADADACCGVGTMANAALWQHHPLPWRNSSSPDDDQHILRQPSQSPPPISELIARGYVTKDEQSGELVVARKPFAAFYAGDYDSAAWVYNKAKRLFFNDDIDSQRLPRKVPIGWALDPELSQRFPPIWPLLYGAAQEGLDFFIAGDSGAGYVNPGALPNGGKAWIAWNKEWYEKFDLNFTGFVIEGDAPRLSNVTDAMYAAFSTAGIVTSPGKDMLPITPFGGRLTREGVPVMHHVTDLPTGISMSDALQHVASFVKGRPSGECVFGVFRTILQPAQFHDQLALSAASQSQSPSLVWVDPATMGALIRIRVQEKTQRNEEGSVEYPSGH